MCQAMLRMLWMQQRTRHSAGAFILNRILTSTLIKLMVAYTLETGLKKSHLKHENR